MIELTACEQQLLHALRDRASSPAISGTDLKAHRIGYGQLLKSIGSNRAPIGIGRMLYHVALYEAQHGRPMVTALAVKVLPNGELGMPSDGFAELGVELGYEVDDLETFWEVELAKAVAFWKSPNLTIDALDAALDILTGKLVAIIRLLHRRSD